MTNAWIDRVHKLYHGNPTTNHTQCQNTDNQITVSAAITFSIIAGSDASSAVTCSVNVSAMLRDMVGRNEERLFQNVPYDSRNQWRLVANSIIDYLSALLMPLMCPDPCLHEYEQLFRGRLKNELIGTCLASSLSAADAI